MLSIKSNNGVFSDFFSISFFVIIIYTEITFFSVKNSLRPRMQSSLRSSWGFSDGGKGTGYNEGKLSSKLKILKTKIAVRFCNIH